MGLLADPDQLLAQFDRFAAAADAGSAREQAAEQQLRARRSLADALPADDRWAPPPAPAPGPTADPPAEPAPRHRLRTYATD